MTRIETIGECKLFLGDCRDILPTLGKADLCLTDPPYGIGFGSYKRTFKLSNGKRIRGNKAHLGDWDNDFDFSKYWGEIKQKSDKFIIWGGNYFPCLWESPSKGIIFWWKKQPVNNFSAGELAWTNLDIPAQHIEFAYYGNIEGNSSAEIKLHPTQKPVKIIEKCIDIVKCQTILDPFMGSGTTGLACVNLGRKFIGIEREPKYFDIACKRIETAYKQPRLFDEPPQTKPTQGAFL